MKKTKTPPIRIIEDLLDFDHIASRALAGPMIRDQHKLHLIPGPQRAAVFHLGRVEEQLLALFHLVVEEPEQAWREGEFNELLQFINT